jgi:hypothetical protein
MSLRLRVFRKLRASNVANLASELGGTAIVDRLGLANPLRAALKLPPRECPALEDLLIHSGLERGYPSIEPFLSEVLGPEDVDLVAERTHAAFARATEASRSASPQGIWGVISSTFQRELVEALTAPNHHCLRSLISQLMRSRSVHGFGAGEADLVALRSRAERRRYGTRFVDALVALAESLGELTVENPEQGRWGDNLYRDPVEIAALCERAMGCDLSTPPVCGAVGLSVGGRLFMLRTPQYAYAVWRCRELCENDPGARVAEIGAGYGGTALLANRLGVPYTCYDLPTTVAIQSIFLIMALGHDRVHLFGEGEPARAQVKVRLLPYEEFFRTGERYRVVLNQDSLPELPVDVARAYVSVMADRSRTFLSINQEAEADAWGTGGRQNVVGSLFRECSRMRRVSRQPYWLRRGYVEEVFES